MGEVDPLPVVSPQHENKSIAENTEKKASKISPPSWLGSAATSIRSTASGAASKVKSSASLVLNQAKGVIAGVSKQQQKSAPPEGDGDTTISAPFNFSHNTHIGPDQVTSSEQFMSKIDNMANSSTSMQFDGQNTGISNDDNDSLSSLEQLMGPPPSNSAGGFDRSIDMDPLQAGTGLSKPDSNTDDTTMGAPKGFKLFGKSKDTRGGRQNSVTFGMSEMSDLFSSSTSASTGERTPSSDGASSAMSMLLGGGKSTSTSAFTPSKAFCSSVADRLENLLNRLSARRDDGGEIGADTSKDIDTPDENTMSEQLKALVAVLRGKFTLTEFDDKFK